MIGIHRHSMEPNQCILVTGASGLVGSALLTELHEHGYHNVHGVTSADVDLTEWEPTRDLVARIRPDVVFHVAARVYGLMGNLQNLGRVFTENIRMNTNVIEAAQLAGSRKIVAMGSAAIYSDATPLPMREDDIWLGAPHDSEGPYAHAKRAMLAHLEAYATMSGLDFAYCVSTNLYGPNDRFDEQWGHVVPSLISKVHNATKSGGPLVVWGSGRPTRDLVYSLDAARALRIIGERGTGAINLATGESHSIREVVERLVDIAGYRGEVIWDESKPEGQRRRSYDVTRLQALGFQPQHTLDEGLRATYRWFDDNVQRVRR